jgi:hypothetical protein
MPHAPELDDAERPAFVAMWFFSAAVMVGSVLAGCTPDPCLQRWLDWRGGRAPYIEVCPIDREMDKDMQKRR